MNHISPVFTEYEQQVIREIAGHRLRPDAARRLIDRLGRPVGALLKVGRESQIAAVRGLSSQVQGWIEEGLIRTVQAANKLTSSREILRRYAARGMKLDDIESLRYLPLSDLDAVADSLRFRDAVLIGAQGALLGGVTTIVQSIPGAQLTIPSLVLTDITTSMTLLSRHTCRISTAFGYSSKLPENLPHLMAAMAPHSQTADEGFFALKTAVITSIRESGQFMARTAGLVMDRQVLEREAPQMIRLIAYVAQRLGITLTHKQLGILVPVAGAILNSSINVAFQQVVHETAKDYFRRLILEDRYGEELVAYAIEQEVELLRKSLGSIPSQ